MSTVHMQRLLANLCRLPGETEWVEFKENNESAEKTGETISALSNGARLRNQVMAYLVWGVRDSDHAIVGTSFQPANARKGNEQLEHWLVRMLTPGLDLRFHSFEVNGVPLIMLEVPASLHTPVQFAGAEYVRVGSLNERLKDYPEKERALWQILDATRFEDGVALAAVDADEAPSHARLSAILRYDRTAVACQS